MTQQRKEQILNEIINWAMEVVSDQEELYDTAINSWGLTPEECSELDIEEPEDEDEYDEDEDDDDDDEY